MRLKGPILPESLLPAEGPRRTLALTTLTSSVGKGIFLTAGVLYFIQAVRMSAISVGLAFSIAGIVALLSGMPVGRLADRCGPRLVFRSSLAVSALSALAFLAATAYPAALAVIVFASVGQAALLVARGSVINRIAEGRPQELRAYVRSVTNVGIALGAAIAGWVAHLDTVAAYRSLMVVDAACFALALVVAWRLPYLPSLAGAARESRWAALRDRPYVALSLLDGVLSIQYRVLTVALPLWIVSATRAPHWLVSVSVVLNTVIVIFFQVRVSRRVVTVPAAGKVLLGAGACSMAACIAIAWSGTVSVWVAAALLTLAVVVLSLGELWQAAGGFELSNTLAPPHAVGQYLGVFGMGMGLAESFGPALLTWLCIGWGNPGWHVMAAVFLLAGLLVPPVARWAAATRPAYEAGAMPQSAVQTAH